jgi:hypothetical protein
MPENKPQIESAKSNHKPATPETTPFQLIGPPTPAKRGEDFGDLLLPGMTQFQLLTRKVKQPARLMQLISHCCNTVLPEALTQECRKAAAALNPKQRTQLYTWLSQNEQIQLSILEKVSTRITALTDIFGHQAVMAMLDMQDSKDALALKDPSDKWSRALYLYIAQFIDTPEPQSTLVTDTRFEQAERRQSMNQHWNSKDYASHYLGPKDAQPTLITQYEQVLREKVAALYPGINPDLIVIDHHCSEDISHSRRHGIDDKADVNNQPQHTISATFNATRAQYRTVIGQSVQDVQIVEVDQPAAIEVVFSWESATGMLGVFCPSPDHRATLALAFQELVLGQQGQPSQPPLCEFDLDSFADATVLQQIAGHLVEGVQGLEIQKIRLTHPIEDHKTGRSERSQGRTSCNALYINRHSRELRDIYQVSRDDYQIPCIKSDDISHVTLSLMMTAQPDCKPHRVAVHLARPNGLTHGCKSAMDRQIMHRQLGALGVMRTVG